MEESGWKRDISGPFVSSFFFLLYDKKKSVVRVLQNELLRVSSLVLQTCQWEDLEDLDVATRSNAIFGCVVGRVVLEKLFHFMRTLYQEGPTTCLG